MKAVDTNILVRYYAQDDTLQSPLALHFFRDEPELFVTKTVLLEFPDALHLAASAACSAFLTFDDRKFARRAQRLNLVPICEIPA